MKYGAPPIPIRHFPLECPEVMHYMYLPIKMAGGWDLRLPENLAWLRPLVDSVCNSGLVQTEHYLYVTARRGYATPDNPINRPGWHTDGFGTDDMNWIWTNKYGTRFACHDFHGISPDHEESMRQFEEQAVVTFVGIPYYFYMVNPHVVHTTPEIPPPGGDRTFVKISRSLSKYNLAGNSHNYLFDYHWKMWERGEVRNDPATFFSDYVEIP
jgi:hypothetical protein